MNPESIKAVKDEVERRQGVMAQSLNVASAASNDLRAALVRAYGLIDALVKENAEQAKTIEAFGSVSSLKTKESKK